MILGSIPTFLITRVLVDEHFWKTCFNKMSFPLLIQQISWSYIDVLYIKMILGSISTFLVTGAFVDEHF